MKKIAEVLNVFYLKVWREGLKDKMAKIILDKIERTNQSKQ